MADDPRIGANIRCIECGARPYPELALPAVVREEFDLIKLKPNGAPADANDSDGRWYCPQHRKPKIKAAKAARPRPSVIDAGHELGCIEKAIDGLILLATDGLEEDARDLAKDVGVSIERLRTLTEDAP
jgi:hypothetical protein